jgi:hypothetical protein
MQRSGIERWLRGAVLRKQCLQLILLHIAVEFSTAAVAAADWHEGCAWTGGRVQRVCSWHTVCSTLRSSM